MLREVLFTLSCAAILILEAPLLGGEVPSGWKHLLREVGLGLFKCDFGGLTGIRNLNKIQNHSYGRNWVIERNLVSPPDVPLK